MKPFIVMQTDFSKDISTCAMEGVCMMVDPTLRVADNTHNIPNFNTYQASTALSFVIDFWPQGTIFVSVVDPGVGTKRVGCVAKLKNGSYVITPDNGTLTHMKKYVGIEEVREIDLETNRLPSTKACNIFHGRDVFAYTAARLASGIISYEDVGPTYSVEEVVEHAIVEPTVTDGVISGMIDSADFHFGLICSNVPYQTFEQQEIAYGDWLDVVITGNGKEHFSGRVSYQPSFGFVEKGQPLLMISETQQIQIAINEDNMTVKYDIECGPEWTISFRKAPANQWEGNKL